MDVDYANGPAKDLRRNRLDETNVVSGRPGPSLCLPSLVSIHTDFLTKGDNSSLLPYVNSSLPPNS